MYTLFPHQENDAQFYCDNRKVANFSDAGTGKTLTNLAAIDQMGIKKTLVLAPKSILQSAWADDCAKFTPHLRTSLVLAGKREKGLETPAEIYLMNHDGINWLLENPGYLAPFENLIIDESTAYKTPTANRTKAAMTLAPLFPRVTILTGTPNPQGVLDLWSQIFLLDQGERLGPSYWKFRNEMCEPIPVTTDRVAWIDKEGALEQCMLAISDILIRNELDKCTDVPENHIVKRYVTLNKKHRGIYEELEKEEMLIEEKGIVDPAHAADLRNKLLQVASGATYHSGGNSYTLLDKDRYNLILDLAMEKPSVVAYNWSHQAIEIEKLAKKRKSKYAVIRGSMNPKDIQNIVKNFQNGNLDFVLIHPKTGAHGLTLTKGQRTIWSSPTDSAELFLQLNRRIHRIGQTEKTETILIVARETREEQAYENTLFKKDNVLYLLDLAANLAGE